MIIGSSIKEFCKVFLVNILTSDGENVTYFSKYNRNTIAGSHHMTHLSQDWRVIVLN